MRAPVDPDHLPEGTMVDCWRVVRPLGGGAYGSVYLVERDGELYALKLARFLRHSGDKRHTDERAQRELSCLLSLDHPHIVRVRFHGRWPHATTGFFYVVMDYVEGYTLAEWMERTHPTPHEVVVLFEKVFSAVAHAHAQRILHRDLKPSNILVEAQAGEPVVVDFGAASFPLPQPQLTDTRLPPGTPRYTSPEARRFANVHRLNPQAHYEYKAADELYALGVTLFDLLTDPLHHSHPRPVLLGGLDIPRAHEVNPRVPLVLSQFVTKLLQSEPGKRPVSVEAARRELAEWLPLQSEAWTKWPVHAPPLPASEAKEAVPAPQEDSEQVPPPQKGKEGEAREQAPREPLPGPEEPESPVPAAPVKVEAPPVATPPPAAAALTPPSRRPPLRAVAAGALVLGLLVAWGAYLSLEGRAEEVPAPLARADAQGARRPTPSQEAEPAPAPPAAAALPPRPPLPQPLAAPPLSTPEKGTAVNPPESSPRAVSSLCAQKQPPPRGTPQWLKWCKCAAVVGTLAATQAGCLAVQVRQSLTEECSQQSVAAMQRLEVEFHRRDIYNDIVVELDVKQPSPSNEPCFGDYPAQACLQEGPLTSRVLQGSGKLVHGTLLSGQFWLKPPPRYRPMIRWTEATLPDGSKHPVCIEAGLESDRCPNGASLQCAARPGEIRKRWNRPLNP